MITIPLSPRQRQQLEAMAALHSMTLSAYLLTIIQREIRIEMTLEERHPHLFTAGADK